eukprot:5316494-Pyramimonas_sp.AAC.1
MAPLGDLTWGGCDSARGSACASHVMTMTSEMHFPTNCLGGGDRAPPCRGENPPSSASELLCDPWLQLRAGKMQADSGGRRSINATSTLGRATDGGFHV